MDDVGASSQSSLPTVNPTPDPAAPAEPQAPDPDLSLPLLDDNARRAELNERGGFLHFGDLSDQQKDKVLNAQVKIERAIEKALLSDGYSRDELSQRNKRDEIRGFLFYRNGKLLSMKTYDSYVKEVELGTHRSQPYKPGLRRPCQAFDSTLGNATSKEKESERSLNSRKDGSQNIAIVTVSGLRETGLDAYRTKIVSIYAQTIHIGGKLEASIVPRGTLECYDGVFQFVLTSPFDHSVMVRTTTRLYM
ncbi:hypothetical protein JHK82_044124 [Glycine max]|nr:hypothetical protein JHK85_058295 [Glycine max]KAG4911402.1 hypothetical protein JHK85_058309 [Glycine max]KAG4936238.1 hypothetical protein JHK85_051157 [Glycine max]KAG5070475.1 hypothetical protein JHK85_002852 [Glycine max]KAG5076067.1 hypothetical protein JHK82_057426 [Glycine max]